MIYLHHNLSALTLLRINPDNLLPIDGDFFGAFLSVQGALAFILTAYAGPGLISPDLSNNALPLYLCRPINRTEYILGKMAVLFIPLSCITWIPGLLLFAIQAGLQGQGWGWDHIHFAWAIFAGSWVWIVLLALLAVALSAWVRWKLAASALLFGIFFISVAFGAMVNEVLDDASGQCVESRICDRHDLGEHAAASDRTRRCSAKCSTSGAAMRFPQYMAWLVLGVRLRCLHRPAEPAAAGERGGIVMAAAETLQQG